MKDVEAPQLVGVGQSLVFGVTNGRERGFGTWGIGGIVDGQ
jgi:hypothetical protein